MADIAESGLSKKLDLKAGFRWMLLLTCILMWFYVAFYGMRFFCFVLFFSFHLSNKTSSSIFTGGQRTWSKWANYFFLSRASIVVQWHDSLSSVCNVIFFPGSSFYKGPRNGKGNFDVIFRCSLN